MEIVTLESDPYGIVRDLHEYALRPLASSRHVGHVVKAVPIAPEMVPRVGYDYPTTQEVLRGGQIKARGFQSPIV